MSRGVRRAGQLALLALPLAACAGPRAAPQHEHATHEHAAQEHAAHASGSPRVAAEQAARAFEALRSLAGTTWRGETRHAEGPATVEVSYELVSGGTTVMERLFPGTPHEMITMYHRDGPGLLMTHYCSAGNQPRMRLVAFAADPVPTLSFDFLDATNVGVPEGTVMHGLELALLDADRLRARWSAWLDGRPDHAGDFLFTRVPRGTR